MLPWLLPLEVCGVLAENHSAGAGSTLAISSVMRSLRSIIRSGAPGTPDRASRTSQPLGLVSSHPSLPQRIQRTDLAIPDRRLVMRYIPSKPEREVFPPSVLG